MQATVLTRDGARALRLAGLSLVVLMAATLAQPVLAGAHGGPGGMAGPDAFDGPGLHGLHPRQTERLLDSVSASAEQRAQVRRILEAAHDDLQARRAADRTLHEQGRQLLLAPTVDAQAVESLRQQMLARHDQASQRMTQALVDVARVLTPEQRRLLDERLQQRRSMMQRHHDERRALDAPPPR